MSEKLFHLFPINQERKRGKLQKNLMVSWSVQCVYFQFSSFWDRVGFWCPAPAAGWVLRQPIAMAGVREPREPGLTVNTLHSLSLPGLSIIHRAARSPELGGSFNSCCHVKLSAPRDHTYDEDDNVDMRFLYICASTPPNTCIDKISK